MRISFPRVLRGATKGFGFKEDVLKNMDVGGPYTKAQLIRRQYEREGMQFVDYTVPELGPGASALIEEMVDIASASKFPFSVCATTKDGVPVNVCWDLHWEVKIKVAVQATDLEATYGEFSLKYYCAKNREEFRKKVMDEETRALRCELEKMGWPEDVVSGLSALEIRDNSILVMTEVHMAGPSSSKKNGRNLRSAPRNIL